MPAFNVVRFRVKPGRDQEFIEAHRNASEEGFTGARRIALIKTGESSYCVIGEWESFDHIVGARPRMISLLDSFRDCLENLGGQLGVTDPVSGETVFQVSAAAPKARRKKSAKRKAASPKRAKSRAKPKKRAKSSGRKPAKKAAARKTARNRR
jgi:Antibiotic biosynthesis monooxygenase